MKYLQIKTIKIALDRIHNSGNTQEHVTSTATSQLIQHYFNYQKFTCTPEQIQVSGKKPDYTIEKLQDNDTLSVHLFVEVKSLVNSNFNDVMDQLYDSVLETVDVMGGTDVNSNFSVYVIAMKATKIAFFEFHTFQSLLDEYNIEHYRGFVPLGKLIGFKQFADFHENQEFINYLRHIVRYDVPSDPEQLRRLGVEATSKIGYPHIWDLLNKDHENYVHNLFMNMSQNRPGADLD